jgi:hypothetical protein
MSDFLLISFEYDCTINEQLTVSNLALKENLLKTILKPCLGSCKSSSKYVTRTKKNELLLFFCSGNKKKYFDPNFLPLTSFNLYLSEKYVPEKSLNILKHKTS